MFLIVYVEHTYKHTGHSFLKYYMDLKTEMLVKIRISCKNIGCFLKSNLIFFNRETVFHSALLSNISQWPSLQFLFWWRFYIQWKPSDQFLLTSKFWVSKPPFPLDRMWCHATCISQSSPRDVDAPVFRGNNAHFVIHEAPRPDLGDDVSLLPPGNFNLAHSRIIAAAVINTRQLSGPGLSSGLHSLSFVRVNIRTTPSPAAPCACCRGWQKIAHSHRTVTFGHLRKFSCLHQRTPFLDL